MVNQKIESLTSNILKKMNIKEPKDIDVKLIAKQLEVDVKSEEMDFNISGLFVLKNNKPHIRYNSLENNYRQRFTIAHELGHFVLHKSTKPLFVDKNEQVLFRDGASSTGEYRIEREANAFAASLLMPSKFIHSAIKEVPNNIEDMEDMIDHLAIEFNVSKQAMNFRMANLGFINPY